MNLMATRALVTKCTAVAVFATAVWAAAAVWDGQATRSSTEKDAPGQAELAAAAGVSPTTLLIDFRDDVAQSTLDGNGLREIPISAMSAHDRLYRVEFADAAGAAAARARLATDPDVESVDYDSLASIPPGELAGEGASERPGPESACAAAGERAGDDAGAADRGFPNDRCFKYQWHMRAVGLPGAWKLGQGAGSVVAVIDTGVSRVPDLASAKFVKGYNFVADNGNSADDHGHGTHVAGTIAQATNNRVGVSGVAFKATIMPLKVLSAQGSGSVAGIAQAIRWAADHGAHVINMSLGGPFPAQAMQNAVKYARGKGVTIVAAAGNDGRGRVGYPAAYPGVMAVAATQFDETTTFYSNWGPEIDIAAPGGNVRVDQNGDGKPDGVLQNTVEPGNIASTNYFWFMGTSMASPHAAGVAALVVGAGVTRPDAVEKIVMETARAPKKVGRTLPDGRVKPIAKKRIDDHYGAGVIDAGAALKKAKGKRDVEEVGLGGLCAALGLAAVRRRRLALSVAGALGLGGALVAATSIGFAGAGVALFGPDGQGNPLLWSALAPLALTGLLYGVRRARPALSGFAFGLAGALLFAAIANTFDVRLVPDFLDRAWLCVNAALAFVLGASVLRRD